MLVSFYSCTEDYVEIYTVKPVRNRPEVTTDVLIGKFCGSLVPGPIISDEDSSALKVYFHSDATKVNSGFRAKYEFIDRLPYGQSKSTR